MNRREFIALAAAGAAVASGQPVGCELVVRVIDKTHPDIFASQTHTKRGDVIAAGPIGMDWGSEVRRTPHYAILRVPDLPMREALALTTEDPGDRKLQPMLHAKAFGLDLSLLTSRCGNGSMRHATVLTVAADQIRAAKYRKRPMRNPFVVGRS